MSSSSYLDNLKSYAHCPLKKRPLHIIDHNTTDDFEDQPQDLRVKRRKERESSHESIPGSPASKSSSSISLQFAQPPPPPPSSSYIPSLPSERPRVTPPPTYETSAKRLNDTRIPPLADFYLQLFQSTSYRQHQSVPAWENIWPIIPSNSWNPAPQAAPQPPSSTNTTSTDSHLSSPRSTSSEDSGVGSEAISEDEIDVTDTTEKGLSHRHTCESCGKSYSTPSGLRKHTELHCTSLTTRTFECKHCSKAYTSVGALKMHIRTHTLPCKCHVCGKAFSRPWLLQGHIRTHTGEKPFECQQCHRSFADRSNLRAHQQTHQRVKKYACHACNKTFSRMSLLNKHTENSCPRTVLTEPKFN